MVRAQPERPELDAPRTTLDEVLAWLLGEGHLSLLDADERLLGERSSPHYFDFAVDERRRRFGDSRDGSGLPYNAAALRGIEGTWPSLLDTLSCWPGPATMGGVLALTHGARSLAPLSALRHGARPTSAEAALFKASLGYGEVVVANLLESPELVDAPPWSAEALGEELSREPWLIGAAQVCAGTRAQLLKGWHHLTRFDDAGPCLPNWREPWFREATAALREIEVLLVAVAGAARASPRGGEHPGTIAARLRDADRAPRMVLSLRRIPRAGPAHATLLCGREAVFESLRIFLEGLPPRPPTDAAFRSACEDVGERGIP